MPRCRTISISGSHRSRFTTGLFPTVGPVFLEPALPPAIPEAVDDIRRVAHHLKRTVEGLGCFEHGHKLHALVRRPRPRPTGVPAPRYRPRHPPGPGFPEHAPSLYTTVAGGTGTSSWSTPTSPLVSSVAAPCSPRGSNTCADPSHDHRGCLRGANPRWAAVAVDRGDTGRFQERAQDAVAPRVQWKVGRAWAPSRASDSS
jgi:hypothetical protein